LFKVHLWYFVTGAV